MKERFFVDTSVLLQAHDRNGGEKRAIAEHVLRQLWLDRSGCLSTQVLQEFYITVTQHLDSLPARRRARELIEAYGVWPVTTLDVADVLVACDYADRYQVSVRDAAILTAARKSRADVLLSERLSRGWHVSGLEVRNPFL